MFCALPPRLDVFQRRHESFLEHVVIRRPGRPTFVLQHQINNHLSTLFATHFGSCGQQFNPVGYIISVLYRPLWKRQWQILCNEGYWIYSVSQKKSTRGYQTFFFICQKRLRIFNRFLHAYYAFLSTLDYKFTARSAVLLSYVVCPSVCL